MSFNYLQNLDDWSGRVHVLSDENSWRRWPHQFRDDLVITPVGIFIVHREDHYTFARPAEWRDMAAFFAPAQVSGRLVGGVEIAHKVPFGLLRRALRFFSFVWSTQRREDVLLLYRHDQDWRYRLHHPWLRSASSGHVDYAIPPTPEGWARFGSFHSHGNLRAFHSRTDERDDAASPGLHVTIGSLEHGLPTLHCVFSHGGRCFDVSPSDVFMNETSDAEAIPAPWLQHGVPLAASGSRSVPEMPSLPLPNGELSYVHRTESSLAQPPAEPPALPDGDWLGRD